MQKKIELQAQTRVALGKDNNVLRADNLVPAVIYGHDFVNQNITVKYSDLEKAYAEGGESVLIDLTIDDGVSHKVIIHTIDRDPLKERFIHVDFYKVKMDEKIKTDVALEFVGEAPAVKELGGSLIKAMDHIEIECLPGDLIQTLAIDLSKLKTFGDSIRVIDLDIPANITLLTAKDATIVLVEETKSAAPEETSVPATAPAEGENIPVAAEEKNKED
ncbi:MAG TPA: 50S ribosomal protein L25 [bacterium]|nr:50S ribosomal protein L25 [bacterium]